MQYSSRITALGAIWLKAIRRIGLSNMPLARNVLRQVGLLPVRDHYCAPYLDARQINGSLREQRLLLGIDLKAVGQLSTLQQFCYQEELIRLPLDRGSEIKPHYYCRNTSYGAGDAKYLYNSSR